MVFLKLPDVFPELVMKLTDTARFFISSYAMINQSKRDARGLSAVTVKVSPGSRGRIRKFSCWCLSLSVDHTMFTFHLSHASSVSSRFPFAELTHTSAIWVYSDVSRPSSAQSTNDVRFPFKQIWRCRLSRKYHWRMSHKLYEKKKIAWRIAHRWQKRDPKPRTSEAKWQTAYMHRLDGVLFQATTSLTFFIPLGTTRKRVG